MAINPSNLINVGTSPNDGQGDALRESFIKTNNLAIDLDARVIDNVTNIAANSAKTSDVNHVTIELPNVNNTSDVNKPVSIAAQSALDLKTDKTQNQINTENVFKSVSFAMDYSDRVRVASGTIESRECVMNEYLKMIN